VTAQSSDPQKPDPLLPRDGSIAVIIPAAGSGTRFGSSRNKLFANLDGKPLWFQSVSRLAAQVAVGRIVMPIAAGDQQAFEGEYAHLVAQLNIELVAGGAERTDSVRAGIEALQADSRVRWIAIHDAARPLVSDADLAAVFAAAVDCSAAILATPISGTVKRNIQIPGKPDQIETVDRRDLWIALTPQVFASGVLQEAYRKHNGRPATDDAELVQRIGHPVRLVHGRGDNLKITYPEDLLIAAAIWARQSQNHHA